MPISFLQVHTSVQLDSLRLLLYLKTLDQLYRLYGIDWLTVNDEMENVMEASEACV
jgi:hypothetical protein